jgi:DHA1 family multidrug resistance protein-like MFS transporter
MPQQARLLFIGLFLSVASNNLFTPLLPNIQHSFGESAASIGVFVSAYGLARLIVDLPSGSLTARLGPKRVVIIGVSLNAGSSLVATVSPSFVLLLAARVGSGIGAGLVATVVLSGLSDIAPPEIRGRVMSLYQVANNLGIALYPLLGGVVGTAFGWRWAYFVAALLSVASGLALAPVLGVIARITRERQASLSRPMVVDRGPADDGSVDPAGSVDSVRDQLRRRASTIAIGAVFFGVVANMTNRHGFRNTVLPLFSSGHLHLSAVQTATGVTTMSLVGIAITIPGAALGDRIGRKRIVVLGLTIVGVGVALFPFIARDYTTFILAAVLVGCGDFFSSSQTALLLDLVDGPRRTFVLGAYRFCVDLGALIGPALLGAAYGVWGSNAAMGLSAAILFAAAAVNWVAVPRIKVGRVSV